MHYLGDYENNEPLKVRLLTFDAACAWTKKQLTWLEKHKGKIIHGKVERKGEANYFRPNKCNFLVLSDEEIEILEAEDIFFTIVHPTTNKETRVNISCGGENASIGIDNSLSSLLLAMEWGFKAHEKGFNLEGARIDFVEVIAETGTKTTYPKTTISHEQLAELGSLLFAIGVKHTVDRSDLLDSITELLDGFDLKRESLWEEHEKRMEAKEPS